VHELDRVQRGARGHGPVRQRGFRWDSRRLAICLNIDGNYNACPFMDDGHSNGSYTTGTATGYLTGLSAGVHTVQTFLYTSTSTTIEDLNIEYHSYS
jgi:hypothetical protein